MKQAVQAQVQRQQRDRLKATQDHIHKRGGALLINSNSGSNELLDKTDQLRSKQIQDQTDKQAWFARKTNPHHPTLQIHPALRKP